MSFEPKVNVLLVDDHPENLLVLEAILESLGQNLVRATSGAQALRRLLNQDFAVILLDVQMPDMDGFETAELIRQRERSLHTPIIFLTAFNTSEKMVFKGYALGAVDYLFKPIEPEILKSKVAAFVDLFQKTAEVKRQAQQLAAMNAELQKREEMFRSLSVCSPVGIFVTDIRGICTYTNPRYQTIFGLQPEESLGEGWIKQIHTEDQTQITADWYNACSKGQAYKGEFRILTSGGIHRWVYLSSSPMLSDQEQIIGYVGTIEDITERKQAEAEHIKLIREQAAREEAETANRLKDEFLATLSHELRTPLTSILGWARLLRQKKLEETAIDRALETIERNASLQAQLIEDILDVSRIIRGKLQLNLCQVGLPSVITAVVDSVRLEAEAKKLRIEFITTPSPSSPSFSTSPTSVTSLLSSPFVVSGDYNRLQQVVWNLVNNAIKFTPEGGSVVIRLSLTPELTPSQFELTHQHSALIEVTDTGTGISSEFLPHVFEHFRQADGSITRNKGGLGLGLAIVRYLVEMHGGSVHAHSPGLGQGATFTVKLPLQEAGAKRLARNKRGKEAGGDKGDKGDREDGGDGGDGEAEEGDSANSRFSSSLGTSK